MESNWRYNVAKWGESNGTWLLAAHLVGTNYPTYRVKVKLSTGFTAIYNLNSPTSLPSLVSLSLPPVAHPHFPYGALVDGD